MAIYASSGEQTQDLVFSSGIFHVARVACTPLFDLIGSQALTAMRTFNGRGQLGKSLSAEVSHFLQQSPVCLQSASDTH